MLRTLIKRKKGTILSGALIIGLASLLSRVLGLFRDRLFAENFGASNLLDSYYAAFRIPDLVFNLLVLGALSSAFVPIFIEYINKDKEEANKIASSILNISLMVLIAVSGLLFLFIPKLIVFIAPGFSEEQRELTALLTRIMLVSPIFFGISNVFSGILNSYKRFIAYSLAPILYNVGIIIGALFFVPRWGIYGLAFGVVLGSMLHMLIQIPAVISSGFKYNLSINIFHQGVKKILKLMIPRTIGLAVTQLNLWVITILASMTDEGGISIFNLSNNLQSLPIGIFGIAFAVSSFPYLADSFSKNNINKFKNYFSKTFCKILFFVIPASILLLIERAQIVRLVLGTGNFDWQDTFLTAQSLGYFSIGVFAQALVPLIARAFYSIQDTKTPVIISITSVAVNIVASLILLPGMGILGLSLAFSIGSFVNILLLLIFLRVKVGDLNDAYIFACSMKIVAMSLIMGGVVYIILNLVAPLVDMRTFWGIFMQAGISTLGGIIIFIALAYLLKMKEIRDIKEVFGMGNRG